jgi:hypothetical protein
MLASTAAQPPGRERRHLDAREGRGMACRPWGPGMAPRGRVGAARDGARRGGKRGAARCGVGALS